MKWPGPQGRLVILLLTALAAGGWLWWLCVRSSKVQFLPADGAAQWIIYPTPANGAVSRRAELSTEFRRSFVLSTVPASARISVRALKRFELRVNGQFPGPPIKPGKNWKQATEFEIAAWLKPGTNEVAVTVFNNTGLPALWLGLTAGESELFTDGQWLASVVGAVWRPAQPADKPQAIDRGNWLYGAARPWPSVAHHLPSYLLWCALAGALLGAGRWWNARQRPGNPLPGLLWAWAGALALAWIILWCHNLGHLPSLTGFDVSSHLECVQYILKRRALPLANEGFEMFQPPLYYLLCAGLLAIFGASPFDANGVLLLRLFGMACGIATFILVFLSLRLMFPGQSRRHFFGLLLAGLLPANLYLCQYITNEILTTTLTAASFYLCLRILANPCFSLAQHAFLGCCLGLGLLTKWSSFVLVPVALAALMWNLSAKQIRGARQWAVCLGLTLLCCSALASWHYARVALHFGNPLIGNWDPASGFDWWQQPGWRTSAYYLKGGRCLVSPFYSGFNSFADGIYSTLWGDGFCAGQLEWIWRPPWNYQLMAAGYLFALLPTLAVLCGLAVTLVVFIRSPNPESLLALGLFFLIGMLLVYYSLKVPTYSSSKAFYGSAALVPLCALGAAGWDFMIRQARVFRLALYLGLGVWAINSYAAFWIPAQAIHTRILTARGDAQSGRHDVAVLELLEVMRQEPHCYEASGLLIVELTNAGKLEDAQLLAQRTATWAAGDADWHLALATFHARQGHWEEAIAEARRAVALAPDHLAATRSLAQWLRASGQTEQTIAACRDALRVAPTQARVHLMLASALADTGDRTNALVHARLAVALSIKYPEAQDLIERLTR